MSVSAVGGGLMVLMGPSVDGTKDSEAADVTRGQPAWLEQGAEEEEESGSGVSSAEVCRNPGERLREGGIAGFCGAIWTPEGKPGSRRTPKRFYTGDVVLWIKSHQNTWMITVDDPFNFWILLNL